MDLIVKEPNPHYRSEFNCYNNSPKNQTKEDNDAYIQKLEKCLHFYCSIWMLHGANYDEAKHGNELLNHFCKGMVDNSNYNNNDKSTMKQVTKETLSIEIDNYYKSNRYYSGPNESIFDSHE